MNRETALLLLKQGLAFTKINCDSTQLIAVQGEEKGLIYYLETGWAKLTEISNDGMENSINICAPGEFIGVATLFKSQVFPLNVTAITPCSLLTVNKSSLESFLLENPQIMAFVFAELGNKVARLRGIKIAANKQNAYGQVRDLLSHFARIFGTNVPGGQIIPFNLTQQDIADFLGISRPRVSICLKSLLELGHIHRQGRYYAVPNPVPVTTPNTTTDINYNLQIIG